MADSVVCVVQARAGSTRLPGKVLADLGGQPMLDFLLARLEPLRAYAPVVVATSTEARDDAVAEVALQAGVAVTRGPEADVLARFLVALGQHPADHVIRLTADCPLTDPGLVAAVVHRHLATGADYTSNVLPRTFPKGLDVEVVRAGVLRTAGAEALDPAEREHVTPFVYRRPERFRLANLAHGEPLGAQRWTVDTPADLETVRTIVAQVGMARARRMRWEEILSVVGRQPQDTVDGVSLRPATRDDCDRLLAWRNEADAVRFSGTRGGVDPLSHEAWFAGRLEQAGCRIYIAEHHDPTANEPAAVGMVRLDVAAGEGTVSIAIDPAWRGRGLSHALLTLAQAEVRADCQMVRLWALVHPDNTASAKAFERAGFVPAGTSPTPSGVAFRTLRWDR